jgi:hypothetical protein
MEIQMKRLTVHHYGETTEEDKRITISPANIFALAADVEDVVVNGRTLRNVVVLGIDGGSIPLTVNHADLSILEEATGSYCLS